MSEFVISKEVALDELKKFVHKWVKKPVSDDKLEDTYPDILEAIMLGNLEINEDYVPTYKLVHPLLNSKDEVSKTHVNFKTRIKPTQKADLAKGIDLQKDVANYSLVIIAFIIGGTKAELDKYEPVDYDVISQVATLFM